MSRGGRRCCRGRWRREIEPQALSLPLSTCLFPSLFPWYLLPGTRRANGCPESWTGPSESITEQSVVHFTACCQAKGYPLKWAEGSPRCLRSTVCPVYWRTKHSGKQVCSRRRKSRPRGAHTVGRGPPPNLESIHSMPQCPPRRPLTSNART